MGKKTLLLAFVLVNFEIHALDNTGEAASPQIVLGKEFSRITLAGQRVVDALRLMEPEGGDAGSVLIVDNGVVTVASDVELIGSAPTDQDPEIRRSPLEVTVKIKMGSGAFTRTVNATGRVGTLMLSDKEIELRMKYVAIGAAVGPGVHFGVSWRFYKSGQLIDSGAEVIKIQNSKMASLALKGRSRSIPAESTIQVASMP